MHRQPTWLELPLPTMAAGIGLLAVCVVCVVAWLSSAVEVARLLGVLSGGGGIYLTVGGFLSWRDRDDPTIEGAAGE